jgi:hypothetical protein
MSWASGGILILLVIIAIACISIWWESSRETRRMRELEQARIAWARIVEDNQKFFKKTNLAFTCSTCNCEFTIPASLYRGEYDHEGGDCRCESCKERDGHFVGRRWFVGTGDTH